MKCSLLLVVAFYCQFCILVVNGACRPRATTRKPSTQCVYDQVNKWNRMRIIQNLPGIESETQYRAQTLIDLTSRSISYLDTDSFTNITSLKSLILIYNNLPCMDSNLFKDLVNLETLGLTGNRLNSLEPSIFDALTNLKTLYLPSNQLTSLNDSLLFKNLNNLDALFLHFNQLNFLHSSLFSGK
jgi:Leucine-rich repeat (LRR) protein